ncbi:MAG: ShlB/FhaC/HecB family hemolysin secretion/activation protein [Chlamydiae bacterium]|nr:ShlB/FhaC/HecB family hemolysin secretion/activation protein [Chlamydiota bacterium]
MKIFLFLILFAGCFANESASPPIVIEEGKTLIDRLNSLTFIATDNEEVKVYDEVDKIFLDKYLFIPDECAFLKIVRPYFCSCISMQTLNSLTKEIEDYYRSNGYPLVSVKVMPGDITDGNIKISVIIARLGEVTSFGAKYFSNKFIKKQIKTDPNEMISSDRMLSDIIWINQNPFYSTHIIYERGQKLGETNIILQTEDRFPLRPFWGYDNTGYFISGVNRYYTGFNYGNVFNLGHQLTFQIMSADKFKYWLGETTSYTIPLPWRQVLKFFGNYLSTKPHQQQKGVHLKGHSWQVSGRFMEPFIKWSVRHNFTFGVDFKRNFNFLSFVQAPVLNKQIDILQFLLGYDFIQNDRLGTTTGGLTLYLSPGNATPFNNNIAFAYQRVGAQSSYYYAIVNFERVTFLWKKFSWAINSWGQYTKNKLLPSEEMSIGGFSTVRGYKENRLLGDFGIVIRNELRTPLIAPTKKHNNKIGQFQLLGFVDYGKVTEVDPSLLFRKSSSLASAGCGLRWNEKEHFDLRIDYGWQLIESLVSSHSGQGRLHVGINAAY